MRSIQFPNMFEPIRTNIVQDHQATAQNIKLLLDSERTSLFGDPQFGCSLRRMMYEQNSSLLRDTLIDELYTTIIAYMPQVRVMRKDISIEQDKEKIYATIKCVNLIDYTTDLYQIDLTQGIDNPQ